MLDTLRKEGKKYKDKLWVSIMAGVVLSDLTTAIGKVANLVGRVVRSMPKGRKGSVAVTFSQGCSALDRETVTTIFSSAGRKEGELYGVPEFVGLCQDEECGLHQQCQ